ncbi:MAG TPA: ABC transporter substrate-binding protein [Cytophagales bacterium]|nr:ABC transporter substrate-binding protein [Cytophagales bacterium]
MNDKKEVSRKLQMDFFEPRTSKLITKTPSRMQSFLWVAITSLLFSYSISAQSLEENKRKFNNGKELYKLGNYSLAMEAFRQVASQRPDNPFYQYASYLYMASAAKANRLSEAMMMAAQLEDKYPDWNKLHEVRFLAADISFKQKKFKDALNYLNTIDRGITEKEKKAMVVNYLSKVSTVDSLKQIHKSFPQNKYVGEVLANRLMGQTSSPKDEELLRKLVKDFKLDTAAFVSSYKFKSEKKQSYNVALLFPFMLDELNPENTNRSNFYAIDMYEGLKLGNEALAKQGIKINLITYDVGKDNQGLDSVLAKPELKNMDLIIGPLSNSPLPGVSSFLGDNAIFAVNPVSSNPQIISNNPLLYLSEPDFSIQGRAAARYLNKNFKPKSAAIFYGGTPKDSIIAFNYHQVLLDSGVEIRAFKKVVKEDVSVLTTVLSDSLNYDIESIFLSSGDQTVAANFISEIEKNGYKVPVIGSPQWLQYSFFNIDQFKRLNVIFIYPGFVDYSLPAVNDFRKNYRKVVHLIPSEFSFIGYDVIQYFGKALWLYGTNFQKNISAIGYIPGMTTPGYDFSKGNSNSFVPLVKFEENDLKVINIPVK